MRDAMHWEVDREPGAVERRAGEWNQLAHAGPFSPTADAIWTGCMWNAFGDPQIPLELHMLRRGEDLVALVPLQKIKGFGRTWSDFQKERLTPYWQFVARASELDEVAGTLLDHLLASAEAVRLRRLQQDGRIHRAVAQAAGERGLHMDVVPKGADCVLAVPETWDEFHSALSTKLRKNTDRALRQLDRMGKLEFQEVSREDGLDALLKECFELETLGWKGESGTTILSQKAWRSFYRELALASAAAGRLALYTLRLDGKLLAYDLCLRAQGRIHLLKISYHPDFARQSPSNVLRFLVFEKEIASGDIDVYHFGGPSGRVDWKLRWTDQLIPLVDLHVYGDGLRGRIAQITGPRTRNALKQVGAVRSGLELLRRARGARTQDPEDL